jgi:hypothetical protein
MKVFAAISFHFAKFKNSCFIFFTIQNIQKEIFNSFQFQKFHTQTLRAMAKDKK